LADAVIVILKDPRLAKELAIAAKAFALEHFSSDKMVAETVNVYRQVKDAVRSVQ
jgi:glycosyltransferase involved in cell wall biosynthesis